MLTTSLKTVVHAQLDTVWNLLLDRIEHPQLYDSRVNESRVLERFPDGVIREMRMDGLLIRERITVEDEHWTIHSELLEHPDYVGTIDTQVLGTSTQNPMAPLHLDIKLMLEMKEGHREGTVRPDQFLEDSFNDELERIKRKAEELEKVA
ncbi:AtaL-like protein [Geobacter sp. SVR]|uniref:AtaL-like protein n=1 Tax=Geobacter sp. SVR TaxID=2495594 RepID=UPI00143EF4FF|nr:AtaL-like protein [Geobacter sp. SVR]BCS54202.1 hypothetical protein GSVR_25100 [Geobacter sp. SVR]GCF85939.1 hypothetical protein GSbR_25390 [Geobacter sp. SVR]